MFSLNRYIYADISHKQSTKTNIGLKMCYSGFIWACVLPIEFNISPFENPEDLSIYISLLKQIGYSQEDLDQIIGKIPNIAEKKER
jgi:hypothetical protein